MPLGRPSIQQSLIVGLCFLASFASAQVPDPAAEGWKSEAFSESISEALSAFGKTVLCGGAPPPDGAKSNALRPALTRSYADGVTAVSRGLSGPATDSLKETLVGLLMPFEDDKAARVKFKVHAVSLAEMSSEQFVSITGAAAGGKGRVEQNGNWKIWWGGTTEAPTILRVEAHDFEETVSSGKTAFVDATAAVIGAEPVFKEQYLRGLNEWSPHIDAFNRFFIFGYNGIALGDVNGDGLEDVYSPQTGGLPNRLFVQQADGTVSNVSAAAGVDFLDSTHSALFADFDNDGDQDLALGLNGGLMVLRNDGSGNFEPRLRYPMVTNAYGLAAADYDLDGKLDLFVCRYYSEATGGARLAVPAPYFDANNGGNNFLLRNEGALEGSEWIGFSDATVTSGLSVNSERFSYAAVWDDFDNDGVPDLYVANDFGKNVLYLNRGGKFHDATDASGLEDSALGMSASSGDFNRDGITDIYVGNMFSAAGSRITQQDQFRAGADKALRPAFRRLARGNSLFQGAASDDGGVNFSDVSVDAGVTLGRWSWGSVFFDFNNDGWDDLFVANGFITGRRDDDL